MISALKGTRPFSVQYGILWTGVGFERADSVTAFLEDHTWGYTQVHISELVKRVVILLVC